MAERSFNQVRRLREARGWTQLDLAGRTGISRTAISAIEQCRMTPSVDAALRIAQALAHSVEAIFARGGAPGAGTPGDHADADHGRGPRWAWAPRRTPVRCWAARVCGRDVWYPAEPTVLGLLPHDRVLPSAAPLPACAPPASAQTLVIAGCDPAMSLLLSLHGARTGVRVLAFQRTSGEALRLLREGVVHLAGVHLAAEDDPDGNGGALRAHGFGPSFALLEMTLWDAGIAVTRGGIRSVRALRRAPLRWIGRPAGSGARQCQDVVLQARPAPRRLAATHHGVAEALLGGWAEAGACVRMVAEDAGLPFVTVRRERYDLCLRAADAGEPAIAALIRTARSRAWRALIDAIPGYDAAPGAGGMARVPDGEGPDHVD